MRLQCCEQGVRDGLCGLVGSLGNDAVACPALSQREQDGAAGLADHGVGLPVSGAGAFLDDLRPLVNRNPAPDLAPAVIAPVAFPALFLATQVGMEITATALVRIDILVDPFVTDMQSLLHRQPAADLLRTPLLAQQTLNPFPSSGGNPRLGLGLAAGQGPVLRLLRAVAAKSAVAPDLTADRGLVTLQHDGNLALVVLHFQKRFDLVAFFLG